MEKEYILVVEDDIDIKDILVFNLKREGYEVDDAENGLRCLEMVRAKKPDLILLDVMMPEMDGLTTSKELAKIGDFPLIFLTAKGEEIDRIVGLELGADDYVVKPFSIRELILRIKSVLRRHKIQEENTTSQASHTNDKKNDFLEHHTIYMDNTAHRVFISDKEVHVTLTEFRLLEDLMRNAQFVRTREQLLESVWGYQFEGYNRTVDTHVRRLRQKLGQAGEYVETVRGLGYRMK